jgi:integrase
MVYRLAKKPNPLSDPEIKFWVTNNIRFDAKADGGGLYLRFRQNDKYPVFFFRFQMAGVENKILLGKYPALSLADARKAQRKHRATIDAGSNPATEKREKKAEDAAKDLAAKSAQTVTPLINEFFKKHIDGQAKSAKAIRQLADNYIVVAIGKLKIDAVKPLHIATMLDSIAAPTAANKVLSLTKRIFDYAIKRHTITINPAAAYKNSDAGGRQDPRDRFLIESEITKLFSAMARADKFTRQHYLVTKLLLLIGCRKGELFKAKRSDFDLINAEWIMSLENKTKSALTIPLSNPAIEIITELMQYQLESNPYLLPAARSTATGYITDNYLNSPIKNMVLPLMTDVPLFTVHDLRRTMRTHLTGSLGVDRFVAERCLNHKIVNMEGVYDGGDYLPERRVALEKWADFLISCEAQANEK